MKKHLALFIAVLLLVSCLSGCGNSANSSSTEATPSDTQANDAGQAVENTSVKIGIVEDPGSFAPYNFNMNAQHTTSLVYQRLFRLNSEGEVTPELAESYEMIDATHYVIKLKDGVVDSAGNPFTASDVLFTIGLDQQNGVFSVFSVDVANSSAEDNLTLNLALVFPDSSLMPILSIIPMVTQASFEASPDQMVTTPVGTGPYVLDEWIPGSSAKFSYNENYWGEEPVIKNVEIDIIAEESQRTTALETGAVDIINNVPTSDVEYIKGKDGLLVKEVPSVSSAGLFFDCSEGSIFNDARVRKAVAYAINKEAIIKVAYNGFAETANSFFSSHCNDYIDTYRFDNYYDYDLDAAKSLLAEAGVADGTPIELITWASPGLREAAQQIQNMLDQIGLKVNITEYENTIYTDIISSDPSKYDCALTIVTAPSGNSADALFCVNMWTQMPEDLATKFGGYYNGAVGATDMGTYQSVLTDCFKELYEELPEFSICHTEYVYGYKANLSEPQIYDLEFIDVAALSWN